MRRAQKAFRERKEKHASGLESKVSDLEMIIEEMSNTFLEFSDELLKSREVDPARIKQTTEVFLALSHRASRALDEEAGETGDELEQDMDGGESSSLELSVKYEHATSLGDVGEPSVHFILGETQRNPLAVVPRTSNAQEIRISDPYGNHLWGTPQNSSKDGTSAIPYILAGRDSFASRLYFESMVLIVRALRGEASRDILDSVYRYKRRYVIFDHILGVTSGVLNMLLHGTSQDPKESNTTVAWSEPDETAIKAAIGRDLMLHGSSEMEFLNTWKVERYLRDKWGLGVDSMTIRTPTRALEAYSSVADGLTGQGYPPNLPGNPILFAPTMVPGFAHSEQALFDAQSLVEKIVLGAVSLGEGPRWHVSFIDGAVKSFLQENRIRL